jgi:hypothetical protein
MISPLVFSTNRVIDKTKAPVHRPVSPEWFDYWEDPDTALRNARFVRTINGKRVRSELRDKDVSFIRAACASLPEDEQTDEFRRALLERVIDNQYRDRDRDPICQRLFAHPHDTLAAVMGHPVITPDPAPDWEAEPPGPARDKRQREALERAIRKSWEGADTAAEGADMGASS